MTESADKQRSLPRKGRGAASKPDARYLGDTREAFDDGWYQDTEIAPLRTTVTVEHSKTVLSRNNSPDIPFEQSVNAYRGCEHGCIYCYARPTHAYMDLSPGLDFESRLFVKPDAPELLRQALAKPGYVCKPIALGTNTDPYQPIEREWRVTRGILELLNDCRHPMTLVTKSCLVERDIDLLAAMSERRQIEVFVSVTTLDHGLARSLEPRATAPQRRIECLRRLHEAGVTTGVMFAPVIPAINDAELEAVLEAATAAGASHAGYVMLRLPHEVKDLFREWLDNHYPDRARHVMSLINDIRDGRDNDANFGSRMRGQGVFAELVRQRFRKTCKRLGLNQPTRELDTSLFIPPPADRDQMTLF
ncbi:DNA repair photolyase [Methylohalomonas lacus]|uniref:DNA repair photolyase n=1 Tax=Methylohalomonas lacus TaxID=398773 RepID=A0AAE3HN42_9GAMM|nr:PA0069 family radical SAM protein [Methylohalomonas lacus]MCS3903587.1 DNA repair photolyase [Methylohalomonas lacus]